MNKAAEEGWTQKEENAKISFYVNPTMVVHVFCHAMLNERVFCLNISNSCRLAGSKYVARYRYVECTTWTTDLQTTLHPGVRRNELAGEKLNVVQNGLYITSISVLKLCNCRLRMQFSAILCLYL